MVTWPNNRKTVDWRRAAGMNSLVRDTDIPSKWRPIRKRCGVNRYEWAFSFPEPDWWGTIFRDVGAQSVGKRSEVSEILRPFSSAA